jgi:glycosyltransferase involved in cell wall biosynthesis
MLIRRRLNVAHLTHSLDMGGAEKLLVEFARHTDRRRFNPCVVSLTTRGVLADEIEATGCPVIALDAGNGFRPGLFFKLAQLFRQRQIDVVHTHDDRPHIYGTVAALLAGVPRVIHMRHGQGLHLSARQRRLVNFLARFADRFVCVSRDSARLAVEQGVPASKVCTIWNGIDTTRFVNRGPRGDGPVVIVARLVPEKDMETLLRAADLVRREDASFRLEIAGDGVCLPQLRACAADLKLDGCVRFLGQTRDVAAVLARAQLFVLSSISEGVSLTLLEAMATGLAVVATNVGGNPEVVADGETGLLVPPRDPAALAVAILNLRRNTGERTRLGLAGRERVEEHFDVRRMVANYEELYGASSLAMPNARCGTVSRPCHSVRPKVSSNP